MAASRDIRVLAGSFLSAFLTACSGAASSDLLEPAKDQPSTEPAKSGEPGTSTGDTPSGSTPSPSAGSSDPGVSEPSKDPDPAPPKPATCLVETEPNNEPSGADTFSGCVEGGLKTRDVDYVVTKAPANAKTINIKHQESGGKVSYRVFVNGVLMGVFGDDPPPSLMASPNAQYLFQVQVAPLTQGDRQWKLEVTFQ